MTTLLERAHGAFLGLAAGDASGYPSRHHRMVQSPERRSLLWTQALELDEHRILRFPQPFSHAAPLDEMRFSATDDAEQAALAADILLTATATGTVDATSLFTAWRSILEPQLDRYWGSVADRSALLNTQEGLTPPATGSDNPHFYDDSAVVRAVPIAIVHHDDPVRASAITAMLASITNDGVGVDAATAFATAVATIVSGRPKAEGVSAAMATLDPDTWLGRKAALAERILDDAGSLFAAVPQWNDEIANLEYNFGNVAAETLPLALLIAREAQTFAEGIALANLIPKQADSLPAQVGALLGAAHGRDAIPETWRERLETLRGVTVPSTAGTALLPLAERLLATA
ncbi:ADP-ribosylglycohydrolase family protein [Microbacterium aurum]